MKRFLAAAFALCFLSLAGQALADGKKVNIFNGAQVDFYTLYISPTNANAWQENLLEEKTLPNGDKAEIALSRTENAEAWDIRVTDKNGNTMTWVGVPINKAGDITLMPNGKYMAK